MRNWFILFATTFTITTLTVTITTWLLPTMNEFDSRYVIMLAISSALLSLCLILLHALLLESLMLQIVLDITAIFTIVFLTGVMIGLYAIELDKIILILLLVIVIYIIISFIYHAILTKEAENMNRKIADWRDQHADSE